MKSIIHPPPHPPPPTSLDIIFTSEFLLSRLRNPLRPPDRQIALGQPLARLRHLDNIDDLFPKHDRSTNAGKNPRNRAIDFIGAGVFHCACGPGVCEEGGGDGMSWGAGLGGGEGAVAC